MIFYVRGGNDVVDVNIMGRHHARGSIHIINENMKVTFIINNIFS